MKHNSYKNQNQNQNQTHNQNQNYKETRHQTHIKPQNNNKSNVDYNILNELKDYILYKTKTRKVFSLPEDGEYFSHTNSECSLSNNQYIEPNINPSGFNTIKSTSRCSIM